MCKAYPNRHFKLDCYERDLVDMLNCFCGLRFYDYHKGFSAKAAALLHQHHLKVDWSHQDHNLFNEIFVGHKTNACQIWDSSAHTANFCLQAKFPNPSTILNPAIDHSPNRRCMAVKQPFPRGPPPQDTNFQGRPRCRLQEFCNNLNDSSCNRSPCPFLHYCAICLLAARASSASMQEADSWPAFPGCHCTQAHLSYQGFSCQARATFPVKPCQENNQKPPPFSWPPLGHPRSWLTFKLSSQTHQS